MRLIQRLLRTTCCGLGLAVVSGPAPAQQSAGESRQVVDECVAGHERTQTLQQAGRYLEARESVLLCSQAVCPELLRADCLEWFSVVEKAIPSLVIAARVGTSDLIRVRVIIDGKVVSEKLDGSAHELDPGAHKFRLEALDRPELAPLETDVLVSRGEKGRLMPFVFSDPKLQEQSAALAPATPEKPTPAPATYRPTPAVTYVLLGAAGLFAVGGGVFGAIGKGEESDLKKPYEEGGCAPYCEPEQVDSVRTKYAIADVGFGLAIASGIGALVSYLARPELPMERSPGLALEIGRDSGRLTLEQSF